MKIQAIARDCFFVMPFVLSMNIPFLKFRGDLKPPQSLSPSNNFPERIGGVPFNGHILRPWKAL